MQWWACKHGAPFDTKWRTIARRVQGRPGDVWAVATALFDAASQAESRGDISNIDLEQIADGFGYDLEYVQRIYAELREKDVHDGQLILNFEKHQPKGDVTAAERKRRQREKEAQQRAQSADQVTNSHGPPRDGHDMSRVTERDSGTVTDGHGEERDSHGGSRDVTEDGHGVTAGHALEEIRLDKTRPEETRRESESTSAARAPEVELVDLKPLPSMDGARPWRPGDVVPDLWKAMAKETRRKLNLPPIDVELEAVKFTNRMASGETRGVKSWLNVWINWALNPLAVEKPEVAPASAAPKQDAEPRWGGHPAEAQMRAKLGDAMFEQWPGACRLEIADGVAKLHAPRRLVRDHVASHHLALMERAFEPLVVVIQLADADPEPPAFLVRNPKKAVAA